MADNILVTPGTGATIAADDIGGGVLVQRIKACLGADGTAVDPIGGAGAQTTGTARVILASDDPAVTLLTALSKAEDTAHASGDRGIMSLHVRRDANTSLVDADGDYGPTQLTAQGSLKVAVQEGSASIAVTATGGYTPGKLISAASTNATSVKTSAATLGVLTASNVNAAARYLKIYNKASGPTVGTDVPVLTFLIPGNTAGSGTNIPLPPQGIALSLGFAFALTTGVADTDTAAVAASEIVVNYGYA